MESTDRLDEIINNGKASKISDKQAREITEHLLEMIKESENEEKVANYLMKFKASACLFFFEKAVESLEPEKIQSIHSAICKTEFYKKNSNNAAIARGFVMSAVLIKHKHGAASIVLGRTLIDAERDGKFSEYVINLFKTTVVDYCGGLEPINALDKTDWDNLGKQSRFRRFMQNVTDNCVTVVSTDKHESNSNALSPVSKDLKQTTKEDAITSVISSGEKPLEHNTIKTVSPINNAQTLAKELTGTLASAVCEAKEILNILRESNGTIAALRHQITERDVEISKLKAIITEREQAIAKLQTEIEQLSRIIKDKDCNIVDLTERLKTAMQMDNISQSQELVTLKTNLQNSLKVEYDDYLVSRDSECNSDSYAALLGSLARIFKNLKRFGINIE